MKIKAAVTYSTGAPFVIEEVELAAPKADEILVKIVACGVCHTDEAAQFQAIPVPLPAVPSCIPPSTGKTAMPPSWMGKKPSSKPPPSTPPSGRLSRGAAMWNPPRTP